MSPSSSAEDEGGAPPEGETSRGDVEPSPVAEAGSPSADAEVPAPTEAATPAAAEGASGAGEACEGDDAREASPAEERELAREASAEASEAASAEGSGEASEAASAEGPGEASDEASEAASAEGAGEASDAASAEGPGEASDEASEAASAEGSGEASEAASAEGSGEASEAGEAAHAASGESGHEAAHAASGESGHEAPHAEERAPTEAGAEAGAEGGVPGEPDSGESIPSLDDIALPEAPPRDVIVAIQDAWFGGDRGGRLHVPGCELRAGVTGVVGRAGAGKTLFCEGLLGLAPVAGARGAPLRVLGHELPKAGPLVRTQVGYLPQDLATYPGMTALELASFVGGAYLRWRSKQVFERLSRYRVPTRQPVEQLSPAERAFLALALALGIAPHLLVVDLPTSLDGAARAELIEALLLERGEASVVLATARAHELEGRCDALLLLEGGAALLHPPEAFAGLWRVDLRGQARPALPSGVRCLQAGPGPHGARWILEGDPGLLPSDPAQVAASRPSTFEEAVHARLAGLTRE